MNNSKASESIDDSRWEIKRRQSDGSIRWANARVVRYADDFVIMAKHIGSRIERFVEQTLQGRFGLTVNRDKTRTAKLNDPGESLDFLGYTFRYDRDLQGRRESRMREIRLPGSRREN